VREAEAHAEEDRRKRDEIETRNVADNMVYNAEKMMRDNADKVPADLKSEVEGKIAAVRSALQGQDSAYIRRSSEELSQSLQKVGQAVYSQTGGQPGPGPDGGASSGPGTPPPHDEGTVEGEFREV